MRRKTHYFDADRRPSKEWTREIEAVFPSYTLGDTRWRVCHCGHPTALLPYYGVRPDGRMVLAPNGRAFQYLWDAQFTVEDLASSNSAAEAS